MKNLKHFRTVINKIRAGHPANPAVMGMSTDSCENDLAIYLCLNPGLEYWINYDEVQLIKIAVSGDFTLSKLAANVAVKTAALAASGKLVQIAQLPRFFCEPDKTLYWTKVRRQLEKLQALLRLPDPPRWLLPLLGDDRISLLSLIHSRNFMPADWLFPEWQSGFSAACARKTVQYYRPLWGNALSDAWQTRFDILLCNREALFRSYKCYGGGSAREIADKIQRLGGRDSKVTATLAAMRICAEFLDAVTVHEVPEPEAVGFAETMFSCFTETSSSGNPLFSSPRSRSWLSHPAVEIQGLQELEDAYPKQLPAIGTLLHIILRSIDRNSKIPTWVVLDHIEIAKRSKYFFSSIAKLEKKTPFSRLAACGIGVTIDRIGFQLIISVEPGKLDALRDRIPDATTPECAIIAKNGFSATALFDTLIIKRLRNSSPMWLPRVYRYLDTMHDFDPRNTQQIKIYFSAEEIIEPVVIYLPLPRETSKAEITRQQCRKELVARYITSACYNYVVTLGVFSITVDCAPVAKQRGPLAFTNKELDALIRETARAYSLERQYGSYQESFNYRKFFITAAPRNDTPVVFEKQDIQFGQFFGIDIGGTAVKVSLFENGMLKKSLSRNEVVSFPTFPQTPGPSDRIQATEFCRRIIQQIESLYAPAGAGETLWRRIDGIGISWPGAVKDSRIVAMSKVLQRLVFAGADTVIKPDYDSPPGIIHGIDLAGVLRTTLQTMYPSISETTVVILENDGNAEAFGNYCYISRDDEQHPGGKLIVKLGTSVAGGHINEFGGISPHVSEFAKILVDFNTKPGKMVTGSARDYIPSIGVRLLSRSFRFNGKLVFGPLDFNRKRPLNDDDSSDARVEAVEIGTLLPFFFTTFKEDEQGLFLKALIAADNSSVGSDLYDRFLATLTKAMKSRACRDLFDEYCRARGKDTFAKINESNRALLLPQFSSEEDCIWACGLKRMADLLSIPPLINKPSGRKIPADFNYIRFAETVLGSVALFSELALRLAHLSVALYNTYHKRRFNEIILSGGVLRGKTGGLIARQTEGFLAKYYDKIFGPKKHLKPGSIRLAPAGDHPDAVGPFGAAMVANRQHKVNSHAVLEKLLTSAVCSMKPGETITPAQAAAKFSLQRISPAATEGYLHRLVADTVLVLKDPATKTYARLLKAVE